MSDIAYQRRSGFVTTLPPWRKIEMDEPAAYFRMIFS
jgi:hypothetical protein